MGKILVTGAAGYVGSMLCKLLLEKQYKVIATDNFHKVDGTALMTLCSNPNFEFVYCDVTQPEHLNRVFDNDISGVVHLAAIVGFPECSRQPGLAKLVNVGGTENVLRYKPSGVPLIFSSTGSVYGVVDGICTENTPLNAVSLYGKTKIEAERLVLAEPNTLVYRFATGFGVSPCMRVNLLVNDLVYQAIHNKSLTIFESGAKRTFIHVHDMARAFLFGIKQQWTGIYNVGSNNNNYTKRDIAELIKKKTNCFVTYAEIGKDEDKRDYEVDYDKIDKERFNLLYSVENGIDELVKVCKLINITKTEYR